MTRKRFQPLDVEIGGFLKTFGVIWLITLIILFFLMGYDSYAFWGALALGFIIALLLTIILHFVTGVEGGIIMPGENKK